MDPGDGSMDGWSWSLQGRVTNTETITQQINYAYVNRGLSYESEGANRNVPVNFATVAAARRGAGPAGTTNYGRDGGAAGRHRQPAGRQRQPRVVGRAARRQSGYIFDAVLHAGGTVRNYGFLVNNIGSIGTVAAPVTDPFAAGSCRCGR